MRITAPRTAATAVIALAAATAAAPAAASTSAAVTTATAPATAPARATASVTGSGQVRLTYYPDRDVRTFTVTARAVPYSKPLPGLPQGSPTDATGTVQISHHVADQDLTVRFTARVDCLITAPGNATLTAVVTSADAAVKDQIGRRIGISVQDGGPARGRVGFSWSVANGVQDSSGAWVQGTVGTCMAPAAFAPVTSGGFTVRHADLPPQPATRTPTRG